MAQSPWNGTRFEAGLVRRLNMAALFAGIGTAGAGTTVLLGWVFDLTILKSLRPGLVAMNPMTAVAFLLTGFSLSLLWKFDPRSYRTHAARLAAIGVASIGLVKMVEMATGWAIGLDQILFGDQLRDLATGVPNRMAPNTALGFVLVGAALAVAGPGRRGVISQALAIASAVQALMAVLGYSYGVRGFYGVTSYIPMALNTALTFLTAAVGIFFVLPSEGVARVFARADAGGMMARRLAPATLGLLPLLGWLRLEGQRAGLYDTEFGLCLTTLMSIALLAGVIRLSAGAMSRIDLQRQEALDALRATNDALEYRVRLRTEELVTANESLKTQIVEKEAAEAALRKSEEQLRQIQKMEAIGRLAGGVAHDFNNILTAILGYSQLIRIRPGLEGVIDQDTREIEKAARRGASLTHQLLAFSRQQVLQPQMLDLNSLIADLDRMLRRLIGADIDMLIAPCAGLMPVKADPGQLQQVLLNLAVNARDAMPEGGKITIETANVDLGADYAGTHPGVRPGRHVMLAVSDTGCGMDAETKKRIFEPFFTTKELGKGTGLGLSTVHGIVHQSEGHIEVYSEPGHGSTFRVYFPAAAGAAQAQAAPRLEPAAVQGSETVLLAEDEEQVRSVMTRSLRDHGYTVIAAGSAGELLERVEAEAVRADILVTDIIMPGMRGPALAKELAARGHVLKVVYMSGYTDKAMVHQGQIDSGTAFLQKPFTPDHLLRRLREVLDGRPGIMMDGAGT